MRVAVFAVAVLLVGCRVDITTDGGVDAGATACPTPSGTVEHRGFITADETWSADSIHLISNELTISAGATVVIAACADVRIADQRSFTVEGVLRAEGTATSPVRIHQAGTRFGSLIVDYPGSARLIHATIEGGGGVTSMSSAMVVVNSSVWPPVTPLYVDHLTVHDSAGLGVLMRGGSGFASGSTALTITETGKINATFPYPLRIAINAMSTIPDGAYTGNGVDQIQVIGEDPHSSIEGDQTMRNLGVAFHVGGNGAFGQLRIGSLTGLATLTIEPGVRVVLENNTANPGVVEIGTSSVRGRLIAAGTQAAPITFEPASGTWNGLDYAPPIADGNVLDWVTVKTAGGPGGASGFGCPPSTFNTNDAAIRLFGEPSASFIHHTTVDGSAGHGILRGWRGMPVDLLGDTTFIGVFGCNQVEPKDSNGGCPVSPSCPK